MKIHANAKLADVVSAGEGAFVSPPLRRRGTD